MVYQHKSFLNPSPIMENGSLIAGCNLCGKRWICSTFGWTEISAIPLQLPREQDRWIMLALVDQGFSEEELIRLNWVRCHQHVPFVSDVFDASGRALDQ